MDHIMQSVQDVMDRSTPRVPPHRYSVNFVPAVNKANSDVKKLLLYDPRYCFKQLRVLQFNSGIFRSDCNCSY